MKQKQMRLAGLLFAGVALLGGCQRNVVPEGTEIYQIYYCSGGDASGGDAIVSVAENFAEASTDDQRAQNLMEALLQSTTENNCVAAIPDGTRLLSLTIADDQHATVDLSAEYGTLSGIDLTLADYCITLTLTQLDSIDSVSVLVNGGQLPYRDIQSFRAEDVLLSSMDEQARTLKTRLYFYNPETDTLVAETRTVELYEGQTQADAILSALAEGAQTEELVSLLPAGTRVLSSHLDDGVCYINLSEEFLYAVPDGLRAQQNVIDSIVNSLCSVNDIEEVQIVVAGESVNAYGGVDIRHLLS